MFEGGGCVRYLHYGDGWTGVCKRQLLLVILQMCSLFHVNSIPVKLFTHTCTYANTHMHICTHAHMHTCMHICKHTHAPDETPKVLLHVASYIQWSMFIFLRWQLKEAGIYQDQCARPTKWSLGRLSKPTLWRNSSEWVTDTSTAEVLFSKRKKPILRTVRQEEVCSWHGPWAAIFSYKNGIKPWFKALKLLFWRC